MRFLLNPETYFNSTCLGILIILALFAVDLR